MSWARRRDRQTRTVGDTSERVAGGLETRIRTLEQTAELWATNSDVTAADRTRQRRALQSLTDRTEFSGASVIAANGTMTGIAAGLDEEQRRELVGEDFSNRTYFQRAARGHTYVSKPVTAESGNKIITVSTPIYRNGTIVGTLNAALHLQDSSVFMGVTTDATRHDGITIRSTSGEVMYERSPDPDTDLIVANETVASTGWTVTVRESREVLAGDLQTITLYQVGGIGLVVFLLAVAGLVLYSRVLKYHGSLLAGSSRRSSPDSTRRAGPSRRTTASGASGSANSNGSRT